MTSPSRSVPTRPTALRRPFYQRLFWLLDPIAHSPNVLYVARTLSIVTLITALALITAAPWNWITPGISSWMIAAAVILLIAYGLNRVGRYAIAVVLTVTTLCVLCFAGVIVEPFRNADRLPLNMIWMPALLILCYMIVNTRGMVIIAVAMMGGILLLPVWYAEIDLGDIVFVLFNTLIILTLLMGGTLRRDIVLSQMHQHVEEIAQEHSRYRELFEATFEAIIIHRNGIIIDVNHAVEQQFGFTRDALIGRHTLEFITPEYRPLAREKYESGSTEPYEARCLRKDGSTFAVEIRGKSHWYRGKQVRVAAVRDITALKQAEQDHLALAIEREKVTLLQRFIGDMSHDLRTPLSVIKTSTYLIEKLAATNQLERLMRQIEVLDDQSNQLQRMLDDLLQMSRLDKADTSSYEFEWQIINPLVEAVINDLRHASLRKNQTLTFTPDPALPKTIIDQREFKRMVKHLLNNAISYTPDGGAITVRTLHSMGWVALEISDTGAGIPALNLPHIFERFYRGDVARGSDNAGTGLGLTIARKIVEAHNGQIEVESEVGKGSTFRVRLLAPTQPSKDGASALPRSAPMNTTPPN
ncbi:MAG: ATP-binding protein [Chloroflexota bacterium]|nr:ATP-binding protein [Chloroflexota bacterium]